MSLVKWEVSVPFMKGRQFGSHDGCFGFTDRDATFDIIRLF